MATYIAQSFITKKVVNNFGILWRSTFEPCEILCTVGGVHVVPANQKINLMKENGTQLNKSYNRKLICCTFVSGCCKFVGLFNIKKYKMYNW